MDCHHWMVDTVFIGRIEDVIYFSRFSGTALAIPFINKALRAICSRCCKKLISNGINSKIHFHDCQQIAFVQMQNLHSRYAQWSCSAGYTRIQHLKVCPSTKRNFEESPNGGHGRFAAGRFIHSELIFTTPIFVRCWTSNLRIFLKSETKLRLCPKFCFCRSKLRVAFPAVGVLTRIRYWGWEHGRAQECSRKPLIWTVRKLDGPQEPIFSIDRA